MRIRKNKYKYKIPSLSQFIQAFVKGKMYDVPICHVSMSIMLSCDHSILGFPTMCSMDQTNNLIWFWPTPDKSMNIRLRYLPPMVEI